MTRVFLVDDHEIVRKGVAMVIDAEPDLDVVGEAEGATRALQRIGATRPDVAVLDVRLPDGSGIDLCRRIISAHPEIRCIMLTAYDDDDASRAAVLAGAAGYVLKDIRGTRLVDGIRKVAAGHSLFAPGVVEQLRVSLASPTSTEESAPALTPRQQQILDLIVTGLTNRQIGLELHIAEKTVKNNVTTLLDKLGVETRTQAAVIRATQSGTQDPAARPVF